MKSIYLGRIKRKMLREIQSIKEIRQIRNSKDPEIRKAYFWLSNAGVDQKSLREYKKEFNQKNEYPYECSYLIKIEWKDDNYDYEFGDDPNHAWIVVYLILQYKPDKEFIKGLKQIYEHSHITCYPLSKVEFSYDYQESIIVDK